MKHFAFLCFFVLLLSHVNHAQTNDAIFARRSIIAYTSYSVYPSPDVSVKLPEFEMVDPSSPPGREMASWGKVLTFAGTGFFITGLVVLVNAVDNDKIVNGQYVDDNNGPFVTGIVMYIAGAGMVGAGIPLWIVGTIKYNKYKAKQKVVFNIKGAGGQLSYRF